MNLGKFTLLIYCWLPSLMLTSILVYGQKELCTGSLGENIFQEGDFGSGSDVLYPKDPGIAPGYQYTSRPPVDDGYYTITNDIGKWKRNWPTWIGIEDNSPDPRGYMMVVNANFEPGIFYEQIVDDVCDNTVYEFSADIINVIKRRTRNHIFPDLSFLIDGQEKYYTGSVPQDEKWHTVGFTFRTAPGQHTIRLTLRNNAPGGYGNDIALDNISFRACGPSAQVGVDGLLTVCEHEALPTFQTTMRGASKRVHQWQVSKDGGATWQNSGSLNANTFEPKSLGPGTYQYRFVHGQSEANLANPKCRALSDVVTLKVLQSLTEIDAVIDAGETYEIAGNRLNETGEHDIVIPRFAACDSVVRVNLVVRDPQPVATIAPSPVPVEEPPPPSPEPPVVETAPLDISIRGIKEVICPGASDGHLRLEIDGGQSPYQVSWSTGQSDYDINGLSPGPYRATVRDANGTEVSTEKVVRRRGRLKARFSKVLPATDKDGAAEIAVQDFAGQLAYQWGNGEEGPRASNLSVGVHRVTITDDLGCVTVLETEVPSTLLPELTTAALRSGKGIKLEKLLFDADSTSFNRSSIPTLTALANYLKDNPVMSVEIGGHTNGLPEHDYCDKLSSARAKAVADWIIAQGIPADRVSYKGYGKRQPVASNDSVAGRRRNQRVEVKMVVSN